MQGNLKPIGISAGIENSNSTMTDAGISNTLSNKVAPVNMSGSPPGRSNSGSPVHRRGSVMTDAEAQAERDAHAQLTKVRTHDRVEIGIVDFVR